MSSWTVWRTYGRTCLDSSGRLTNKQKTWRQKNISEHSTWLSSTSHTNTMAHNLLNYWNWWPSDATGWHRSGSTLVQVMAFAWGHQAITWTTVDLSSMGFFGKYLKETSHELKFLPHLQGTNELTLWGLNLNLKCIYLTNKANLRDLIAATGLLISNWIQIVNFSAHVTVKFDGWPCKTIGHLFYATSSFVHLFVPIGEFKLKLQSWNAQSGSNWMIFRAVRPWNLTDDLAKQ